MKLYLVACGILFLAFAGGFFYVLRRRRAGFRFQTRLTVILLLATLVPAVPLILLSTMLLNQSLNVLVADYLEDALDGALEVVRAALIERNAHALDLLESAQTPQQAAERGRDASLSYAFRALGERDSLVIETIFTRDAAAAGNAALDRDALEMVRSGDVGNIFYQEERVFESYRMLPDSSILVAGMPVDSATAASIGKIEQSIASYGLLHIVREQLLDRRIMYALGIFVLFALSIAAVIAAARLSRGINRPIRGLAEGFRRVGEGDLDVRVSEKAKDEIEFLLKSFNGMVASLKSSRQRLVQSERLAAWRDVARQISHEIKNPLTPIQLSLHRLRKKIAVPEEHAHAVEESFETIEEEIESLRRIASEFSEFARLPKPRLVSGNINDIIRSAAALYEKNDKNIPVNLDLSGTVPERPLDPEQMKRVFINVIKNGIEATGENGGALRIRSSYAAGVAGGHPAVVVEVSDAGCGMDDDTLRKIFDPYFTTKKGGAGLGMPVIKRIVEEHNGDIVVDSSPGEGTTVRITLKQRAENPG